MSSCKKTSKRFLKLLTLAFGFLSAGISSASHTYSSGWETIEYLYGWVQDSPISVPLITQNNNPAAFGFINEPGTKIVFGAGSNNSNLNLGGMSGARFSLGTWLDSHNKYGLEASGFGLAPAASSFSASSANGHPPITNIPFLSTAKGENVLVNRTPNTVSISDTFQTYGFEFNGLYNLQNQFHFPLMLLAGFRYLNVNEALALNDAIFNASNTVANVKDNFATTNNFYGLQIGAQTNFAYSNFVFDVSAKVAAGNNFEKLTVNGQTNINNTTLLQPIGLFAEPTNSGSFKNNQFTILPELQLKAFYNLNKIVHPFIAYNCMYINKVIRPGNQIDRRINQSQNALLNETGESTLSGAAVPTTSFNSSSIWIQTASIGVRFDI